MQLQTNCLVRRQLWRNQRDWNFIHSSWNRSSLRPKPTIKESLTRSFNNHRSPVNRINDVGTISDVVAGSDSIRKNIFRGRTRGRGTVSLNRGISYTAPLSLSVSLSPLLFPPVSRTRWIQREKRSIDDSFLYSSTIKDNTRYTLQCVSRLRVSRQAFVGSTEITFNDTKRSRLDSRFTEPVTMAKKKKKDNDAIY